jgi:NAD(P)-dependent dehydrogenase (short-subunit alcohol dehydrogenase family)
MEVGPFGIRVLSIEPGFFKTAVIAKGHRTTDPDSPYRELDDAVGAFMDGGIDGGADPETVARAILDAVDSPDGRVHVPVGDDAHAFLSQDRSSTDAEMAAFYALLLGIPDRKKADSHRASVTAFPS